MIQYLSSQSNTPPIAVSDLLQPGSWVRVEQPSTDELHDLLAMYELEETQLTDALDPHEIPRIEVEEGILYFITRLPDTDDDFNDFTTPILFVIHPEQIITLSRDSLARLWEPFIAKRALSSTSRVESLTYMMEAIIQNYYRKVLTINRQMRAVSSDITRLRPREIGIFVEYERKLNDYVDALIPTNVALKKLLNTSMIRLTEDERDAVEDLSIELEQVIGRCKSLLRTIVNVRDSFRTVMDTRLNETIRLLTVITLALTVPTMVSGLFGMNVPIPGFAAHSAATFWIVLVTSLSGSSFFAYYFLYRRQ